MTLLANRFTEPGVSAIDAQDGVVPVTVTTTPTIAYQFDIDKNKIYKFASLDDAAKYKLYNPRLYAGYTIIEETSYFVKINYNNPNNTLPGKLPSATFLKTPTVTTPTNPVDTTVAGTFTVTYIATDSDGMTTTKTRTVIVDGEIGINPNIAPVITITGDNPLVIPKGAPKWRDPTAWQDPIDIRVVDPDSSFLTRTNLTVTGTVDVDTVGSYILTYTATDEEGLSSSVTRTINVVNTVPTAEAQSVSVNEDTTDNQITLNGTDPNGDSLTYSIVTNPSHGTVTLTGNIAKYTPTANYYGSDSFTFKVNDGTIDSVPATVTITVTDVPEPNTPPVITLNGNTTETIATGSAYTDPGAIATDAEDGTLPITVVGAVDTSTVGTYTLAYTATDSKGLTATVTRIVHVVDTISPTVTLNGASSITLQHGSTFTDPGVTYTDNAYPLDQLTLNVTGSVDTNTAGTYTLTYTVTDPSNNSSSVQRTVVVQPNNPPVVTLNGSANMTLAHGSTYNEPGATATDAEDGTLPVTTKIVKIDSTPIGITTDDGVQHILPIISVAVASDPNTEPPTISAEDLSLIKNVAGWKRLDLTNDSSAPNGYTEVTTPVLYTDVPSGASGYIYYVSITQTSTEKTIEVEAITYENNNAGNGELFQTAYILTVPQNNLIMATGTSVVSSVDTSTPGTYTLTYSATDSGGMTATETRTVVVQPNNAPVIIVIGGNETYGTGGVHIVPNGYNPVAVFSTNVTSTPPKVIVNGYESVYIIGA